METTRRQFLASAVATGVTLNVAGCRRLGERPSEPTRKETVAMNAATGRATSYEWPDVDSFLLSSAHLRQDLKVSIAPLPGAGASRRHATAYVLDPAFNFTAAVDRRLPRGICKIGGRVVARDHDRRRRIRHG